jgi:hypothetical protein
MLKTLLHRDCPSNAIYSARVFILEKYSDIVVVPFLVVASAMRMLRVQARVGDANISSNADHDSTEVVVVVTPWAHLVSGMIAGS